MKARPMLTSVNGHSVLGHLLPQGGRLIDLGANRGAFARAAQDRFGLKCELMVEANPTLTPVLASSSECRVEQCAVASQEGTLLFNLAANDEGSSIRELPRESSLGCTPTGTVVVRSRTLASLVQDLPPGNIDLLKMDIEGAEVEVLLSSPREVLERFSQITVEFHCHPVFGFGGQAEVMKVMSRLRRMGFDCLCFGGLTLTDVLFVNHRQLGLSILDRARIRLLAPPPAFLAKAWMAVPGPLRKLGKSGIRAFRGS